MEASLNHVEKVMNQFSFDPKIVASIKVLFDSEEELSFFMANIKSMNIKKMIAENTAESKLPNIKVPWKNDIEPIQEYSTIKSLEIS